MQVYNWPKLQAGIDIDVLESEPEPWLGQVASQKSMILILICSLGYLIQLKTLPVPMWSMSSSHSVICC